MKINEDWWEKISIAAEKFPGEAWKIRKGREEPGDCNSLKPFVI
jgi:hypothetical protein